MACDKDGAARATYGTARPQCGALPRAPAIVRGAVTTDPAGLERVLCSGITQKLRHAPRRVDADARERPCLGHTERECVCGWPRSGMLSLRALSRHNACTLNARPWYSSHAAHPPANEAGAAPVPRSARDETEIVDLSPIVM